MKALMNRAILALGGVLLVGTTAQAASLVNLTVQGSTDGSTWVSDLSGIAPGTSIQYRVIGQLAPVGTSNVNGGNTTITSLDSTKDGIGSLKFNLTDSDVSAAFNSSQLSSEWTLGSGPSNGTIAGNTITAIRPIAANGTFWGATTFDVISTGTLTVGTAPEIVGGSWTTGGSGGAKFNSGAKSIIISGTTETSADPYVGYTGLTINAADVSAVPAPSVLGASAVLALVGACVAIRRRQQLA